jgi:hypothetical protein
VVKCEPDTATLAPGTTNGLPSAASQTASAHSLRLPEDEVRVGQTLFEEGLMADEALFIGWGEVVRGRESKALEVFNESLQYYGQLQQDGKIESVDAWFLAPHGGDLAGFILLRGDREQLDEVQRSADFELLQTRAGMIVDRVGVVNAYTGEALGRLVGQFQQATAELGT